MSFQYIQQRISLLNPVYTGQPVPITVDSVFTGSAELISMFQQTLDCESFTLQSYMLDNQPDCIRITGFVDLLNCTNLEFDLKIQPTEEDYSFQMKLRIPVGWTFFDSFPEMPLLDSPKDDLASFPTLMDIFRYGSSYLVFSNVAGYDEELEMDLVQGVSFLGDVEPPVAIETLTSPLGIPTSLHMTGPVLEYLPKPDPIAFTGIRLSAAIPVKFDFGGIKVLSSRLMLKSPVRYGDTEMQTSAIADPGIYIFVEMEVDGRPLEIMTDFDPVFGMDLTFRGYFKDFAIGGLSVMDTSVGGAGMADQTPTEIGPPTGLSLTEFGFNIDLADLSISYIYVGIGCGNTWELVPEWLFLSQLGLRFTINAPFQSGMRSYGVAVSGILTIKDVGLEFYVDYPSLDFRVRKSPDDVLSLGDLIEAMVPSIGEAPAVYIETLNISGNAQRKSMQVSGRATQLAAIEIGKTAFAFDVLAFYMSYIHGGKSSGMLMMECSLAEAMGTLQGTFGAQRVFSGSLTNASLHGIYMAITGEETVPEQIPEVSFATLNVTYNQTSGAYDINGKSHVGYYGLGTEEPIDADIQFQIAKLSPGQTASNIGTTASNATTTTNPTGVGDVGTTTAVAQGGYIISLTISSTSIVEIVDQFSITSLNLILNYTTATGLVLSGTVGTVLLGQPITLQAGLTLAPTGWTVNLTATAAPALELLGAEELFHFTWSRFDFMLSKVNREGMSALWSYRVRVDTVLEIEGGGSHGGALEISGGSDGRGSILWRNLTTYMYKVGLGNGVGFHFRPKEIGIGYNPEMGFVLNGQIFFSFEGVPGKLGKMLPENGFGSITLGSQAVRFDILNPFSPFEFPLPDADGKSLGKMVLDIRSIGIALVPSVGLTAQVGLGIPKELNDYFGQKVFREYEPGNPMSESLLNLTVGLGGINLQFLTSPFIAGTTSAVGDAVWFHIDFGKCGAIKMQLPNFRYDMVTSYFEASGGFEIERPLSIPLTPLLNLLRAVHMDGAADIFPERVPVSSLDLIDKDNNLDVDGLVDFLKQGGPVEGEVASVIRSTANLLNRFPDSFKEYFKIAIPSRLDFKFGFSPMGRVALGLHAPVEPVRVMFTSMVPGLVPLPGLIGIQIRELTLGTLLSGSLFYGQVDAIIEMYDMASLAISLMLPRDESFPLPTSDELLRRVILEKVFCIIPLTQGVPVPLPVFYDDIGFEYLGVEGVGLQAHMGFPAPDLSGAGDFFNALKEFFNDRKVLLDPKTPPGGVDLAFQFHDEFLLAPEYLGGQVLGTRNKVTEVGLWQYVARAMNFCKTFSINDAIQSIPLEHRAGSADYKLAFMNFNADWMLTTPQEFRDGAWSQLQLSASDVEDFMDVLPGLVTTTGKKIGNREEGIVAFVRGEADLGFLRLEAVLGLAASASLGFNTGFKLDGTLAGIIDVELKGAILVNAPVADATTYAHPSTEQIHAPGIDKSSSGGKTLRMDGKIASVTIPSSKSLLLPAYTVEFWLKMDAPGEDWKGIVGKPGRNCCVFIHKDGYVHHRFHTTKNTNAGAPNTPAGSVKWGQWQHIAITNDGTTARTYIDGVMLAEGGVDGELVTDETGFIMGRNIDDKQTQFMAGSLQEVRIWKRARTGEEIGATRLERVAAGTTDLVSLYRFDSDTGLKVVDACGLNPGVIVGGAWVDSDLLLLEGLTFNGTSDYIEVPDSESLRIGAYTVEAWIRPSLAFANTWGAVVGKKGRNYAMIIHATKLVHHRFHTPKNWNDGIANSPAGSVAFGGWNHIAITNDGKTACTYINGELKAQGAVGDGGLVIDNTPLQIGRRPEADLQESFTGDIAEVRIWSGARSQQDIAGNMRTRLSGKETNLVSLYRLGEMTDANLADICGRNPGKGQIAALTVENLLRHDGLILNGSGDYAVLPANDGLKPSTYTVEAWILPTADQGYDWTCVVGGKPGCLPSLWISKQGAISHRYPVGGSNSQLNTDNGLVAMGEWNHVAITADKATVAILLNGRLVKSAALTKKVSGANVPVELSISAAPIQVGRHGNATNNNFFRGGIDDIRIWSLARTEEQVSYAMDRTLNGKEAGLLYWADMDHTGGKTIVDKGPLKANGAVSGATWALAATPVDNQTAAVQLYGHAHVDVLGHRALQADLRLIDGNFWFQGIMSVFPDSWPIAIKGHVEGQFSKDRFYIAGDVEQSLFGLTLLGSRFYLSNEKMRLEGRFLGAYALLDIGWEGQDPHFTGSVSWDLSPSIDFGTIYVGGVQVAKNFKLSLDLHVGMAISMSKAGFSADLGVSFNVNGKGFSLSFSVDVPPSDLEHMLSWIKKRIIDNAIEFLAHIFGDVAAWLKNIASGAIEWIEDAGEAVGRAMSKAYRVVAAECAPLLKAAGYAGEKVGKALAAGYNVAAGEAAKLMKSAGYAAAEVGKALTAAYNVASDEAVKLMKAAGYAAAEVGKALSEAYNQTAAAATTALKAAGYAAHETGAAIKDAYGKGVNEVSGFLKDAGYGAAEVGGAIKNAFGKGADEAASLLKGIGYGAEEVGGALKDTFGKDYKAAAKLLKSVGYGVEDVGKSMKNTFGKGAEDVGKVLKDIGYGAEDVSKVCRNVYKMSAKETTKLMKNSLKWGKKTVQNAMKSAGYAGKEIKNAFEDLWDGLTDWI